DRPPRFLVAAPRWRGRQRAPPTRLVAQQGTLLGSQGRSIELLVRIVLIKTVESLQEFILLWGQLHAVVSQALPQPLDALERLVGANQFAGHNVETKALLDGAGIQCLGMGVHGWARVKKLAGADQIARL